MGLSAQLPCTNEKGRAKGAPFPNLEEAFVQPTISSGLKK